MGLWKTLLCAFAPSRLLFFAPSPLHLHLTGSSSSPLHLCPSAFCSSCMSNSCYSNSGFLQILGLEKMIAMGNLQSLMKWMDWPEQQGQLKVICEKFKEQVNQHLRDCRSTFEGLEVYQTLFKGTVQSKIPKLLLHRLFPNVRYSIWIDGKLQLVVDPYQVLESLGLRKKLITTIAVRRNKRPQKEAALHAWSLSCDHHVMYNLLYKHSSMRAK